MTTGRVLGQSLSVAVAGAIFTGLDGAAAGRALAVAATTSLSPARRSRPSSTRSWSPSAPR
jgi:hypothetical protein